MDADEIKQYLTEEEWDHFDTALKYGHDGKDRQDYLKLFESLAAARKRVKELEAENAEMREMLKRYQFNRKSMNSCIECGAWPANGEVCKPDCALAALLGGEKGK